MAFTYVKLMEGTQLPTSALLAPSAASAIYANPAATTTYIADIEIHNTNSLSASAVIYLVPDSSTSLGTPALSSEIIKLTLAAFDTVWIEPKYPYVLTDQNDAIFGSASISAVNIVVRGAKDV